MAVTLDFFKLILFLIPISLLGFKLVELNSNSVYLFRLPIYLSVGLVAYSFSLFLTGIFNIPFWITFFILTVPLIIFARKLRFVFKTSPTDIFSFSLLLMLGVLFLSSTAFFEGLDSRGNLVFWGEGSHDALWHLALQQSIDKVIPPMNPVLAPFRLEGYHYLLDIFYASISTITGISPTTLYLKLMPIFLSLLWVSTGFLVFNSLTKNKLQIYLYTILLCLGSGFAYLAPVFFEASNNHSVFWLDQPARFIVNQQLFLGLILINVIVFFIINFRKRNIFLVGLILGSLVGIKIYAFVVIFMALSLMSLIRITRKDFTYFKVLIIASVIATPFLFFAGGSNGFPFIFKPFWFISSLFESGDRLNNSSWELQRLVFLEYKNYPRLIFHVGLGVGIFLVGNFGLKILGVFTIFGLIDIKKKRGDIYLISLSAAILSILLPLLFIQQGVVWNSIQFMHFAQLPLVILFFFLMNVFGKKQIIGIVIITLLSIPTTISELVKNFNNKNYVVYNQSLLKELQESGNLVPKDKTLIVGSEYNTTSLVPAIAEKNIFYADPIVLNILRINTKERLDYIDALKEGEKKCHNSEFFLYSPNGSFIKQDLETIYNGDQVILGKCRNGSVDID